MIYSSLPPVNFSGTWLFDPSSSDSLAPLMLYHGLLDDTILKYAEMILEDDCLTEYEIQSIRMLRMFLGVEEGEFAKYGYMDRIERMIIDQMEILYADNKINKKEMLHKSDIQGIFGLGYDEYQEIVNKVAIQAYSRGANMQDLDTYL